MTHPEGFAELWSVIRKVRLLANQGDRASEALLPEKNFLKILKQDPFSSPLKGKLMHKEILERLDNDVDFEAEFDVDVDVGLEDIIRLVQMKT